MVSIRKGVAQTSIKTHKIAPSIIGLPEYTRSISSLQLRHKFLSVLQGFLSTPTDCDVCVQYMLRIYYEHKCKITT